MNTNTPHTFIALSGRKQVGKDTAASMITRLLESRGKKVVTTAFAEPLKSMCIDLLGLKREEVYGTDAQKNALSHILWDGFPMEVRLKYSNEFMNYQLDIEGTDPGPWRSQAVPRSGPMTNREVLQVMGTDIFRAIYGEVWSRAPFRRSWGDADVVILTDCRFPNEMIATEEAGGIIIRLERETGFIDNHPSEIALDGYNFENKYRNGGSLNDLENYVRSILIKQGLINNV